MDKSHSFVVRSIHLLLAFLRFSFPFYSPNLLSSTECSNVERYDYNDLDARHSPILEKDVFADFDSK